MARPDLIALAVELPRKEFIARYVVHATRSAEGRRFSEGMRVVKRGAAYIVRYPNGAETPARDVDALFEIMRRGPLNEHVREAERLREYAHS